MPECTCKQMEPSHVSTVLELWKSTEGIYLHAEGEDSEDGIRFFLERNPGFSYIAFDEHGRVAGALLCGHDGRRGFIYHLAVRSDCRRHGIARKMLDLSLERLKSAGIKKTALFVLKKNDDAMNFYEHSNWSREDMVFMYSKNLAGKDAE